MFKHNVCIYHFNLTNFSPDLNKTTLPFEAENLLPGFTPNYTMLS